MIDSNTLYSSKLQKIPTPHFVVFYNGTQRQEDRWENCLSESFLYPSSSPKLELKVLTINVNAGHNKELMEQCQILREYAQYVEKVRFYAKENDLDEAVERAVCECIREGILADFLRKNRSEVIAMSIFEYDEKAVRRLDYSEGYEDGVEDGYEDGVEKTIKTSVFNMLKAIKYTLEDISDIFQIPIDDV